MLHKKGKVFRNGSNDRISSVEFKRAIADALSAELGGSNRAAKMVMKWAGVSERTAKNWVSATHGPSGEHLIELIRRSDAVLEAVLSLADRPTALASIRVTSIKAQLVEVLNALEKAD